MHSSETNCALDLQQRAQEKTHTQKLNPFSFLFAPVIYF